MTRIWHHGALRSLPLWLTITAVDSSVLLGFLFWKRATGSGAPGAPLVPLLVIFWLAVALYLLFGKPASRGHQIDLALPIAGRELWLRHFSGTLLGAFLVAGASLGVLFLHRWLLGTMGRGAELDLPTASLVLPLLAGTFLATALVASIEPELWEPRQGAGYWLKVCASLAAVLALLLALSKWPAVGTLFCLVAAAQVLRRTLRALPEGLRLVPAAPGPAARVSASGDRSHLRQAAARPVSRWRIYRTIYSVVHIAPPWNSVVASWAFYLFIALTGFLISGGFLRWTTTEELRYLYLPFGAYMLIAGLGLLTYHLYRLDPLPIPRRTLFAILMLPGLTAYLVGYGAGLATLATAPDPRPAVDYKVLARPSPPDARSEGSAAVGAEATQPPRGPMVWVEVDPAFMGVTFDGRVPILTAPWGESHPAWSEPLARGLPVAVYNPFNTTAETTAGFEALLASRAIEAAYGRRIEPEEIEKRYFEVEDDRVVGLLGASGEGQEARRRPLTPQPRSQFAGLLRTDHPDLREPSRGPEIPVYMALVLLPWLLLSTMILGSFRATRSPRRIRWMYWLALGLLMGVLVGQVLLSAFGLVSLEAGRTLLAVLIHALGADAWLRAVTWIVCLGVIASSYRLALRQFERAEIPASPINCSLVDWGGER